MPIYSDRVTIDCEAIADDDIDQFIEDREPPSNYKNEDAIARWRIEDRAKQRRQGALNIDLARLVAIGVQVNEEPVEVHLCKTVDEEREVLLRLSRCVWWSDPMWRVLTFNGLSYDLPLITRRCQLLSCPPPKWVPNRYRPERVIDLMLELSFSGLVPARALRFYAKRFKLPIPPDPVTGAAIDELVAAERWSEVWSHCASDVLTTTLLGERLQLVQRPKPATVEGF